MELTEACKCGLAVQLRDDVSMILSKACVFWVLVVLSRSSVSGEVLVLGFHHPGALSHVVMQQFKFRVLLSMCLDLEIKES